MDKRLYDILNQLPRNITLEELEKWYIIVALDRNDNNRTKTTKEIKISMRNLHSKIKLLYEDGYPVVLIAANKKKTIPDA